MIYIYIYMIYIYDIYTYMIYIYISLYMIYIYIYIHIIYDDIVVPNLRQFLRSAHPLARPSHPGAKMVDALQTEVI